ncbi:MAG TPA: polysaccharide deacetylase family protein [Tepidisphaeraceae bacterium]|nr:polysaccharide deacetylase family protein [Tepidisphaeraceae bacterium]
MINRTQLVSSLLVLSGFSSLLRKLNTMRGIIVPTYHRIGDPGGSILDRGVFSATPEGFDAQVRFLKTHFDVIGPGDLPTVLAKGDGRYVLITFDDGYYDNYEYAFPILKSHGVGATFFIATGFIDQPQLAWWDEIAWMVRTSTRRFLPRSQWLRNSIFFDGPTREWAITKLLGVYKSLPAHLTQAYLNYLANATGSGRCNLSMNRTWMSWDMLREMKAGGMWIGGHTANHAILARLSRERQEQEILVCRQRIEAELKQPMKWFSYPRGKPDTFNHITRACLKQQGVELAFSYYSGYRRFDQWDPYDIRRTPVESDTSDYQFQTMITLPQFFA